MTEPTPSQWSLLPDEPEESQAPDPLALALAAALRSRDGHFYELTGHVNQAGEPQAGLAERWRRFFAAGGAAGWQELSASSSGCSGSIILHTHGRCHGRGGRCSYWLARAFSASRRA